MAFNYTKWRKNCRVIRAILGVGLTGYGAYSGNNWFYLGAIPLAAAATNFCPACIFSKKCDLPQ